MLIPRLQISLAFVTAALLGCSSPGNPDASTDAPVDTSMATDAPTDANAPDRVVDAAIEGGAMALHDCTTFVDRTDPSADRMVHFHSTAYSPRCMAIRAGQSVTFMGDLSAHPLNPGVAPSRAGDPRGTEPNPIPTTNSGDLVEVTFPTAGLYPFYCSNHEATASMYGVIEVR